MLDLAYFPLFLKTGDDRPVLLVGGGAIATAKAEALTSTGMRVDVITREASDALKTLAQAHDLQITERDYDANVLAGYRIVVAATDDDDVNARIAADCKARDILVNVVDAPELCDFIFPALIRRGDMQIAVSTSGVAPVLARMVKQTIERATPPGYSKLASFLSQKKDTLRDVLPKLQPRRLFLEEIVQGPVAEELLEGNESRAEELFNAALARQDNASTGALYLVGAGPGNPELMTLKAIRLLAKADVVLHDRLIPPDMLAQFARKDAEKISVGKSRGFHKAQQENIDTLIERHLRKGHIVVRLKGGDPGIFAHGAEEIAVAKRVGAPYQVVPGITAANGCAAYAGFPLTARDVAKTVRVMTLTRADLDKNETWASLQNGADETLVFYMCTPHYTRLCAGLLDTGFDPDTPLMVIEQGTTPYHREFTATIGTFAAEYGNHTFATPCLLVVGDVVGLKQGGWKETAAETGQYFHPLIRKELEHA